MSGAQSGHAAAGGDGAATGRRPTRARQRGASTALATVLVAAVVFASSAAVFGAYLAVADDRAAAAGVTAGEGRLVEFRGAVDRLLDRDDTRTLATAPESDGGATSAVTDAGRVRVAVGGTTVADVRTGTVDYRVGDEVVRYQSGAVIRDGGGRAAGLVAAPRVDVAANAPTPSLSARVVAVRPGADAALDGTVVATVRDRRDPYPRRYVPAGTDVRLTVESPSPRAWAAALRPTARRWDAASLAVDADAGTVTLAVDGAAHGGFYLHLVVATVVVSDR